MSLLDTPAFSFFCALNRKHVGLTLLVVFFGLDLATLYWGQFGDEADNLVVGSLLQRDYVLYRDLFSHHFPFPYYWMAAVVSFFGKSILSARLSLLIFQAVSLALAMRLTGEYVLIGIHALIWSIVKPFYLGNMLL